MPGITAKDLLAACAAAQEPAVNTDAEWRSTEQLAAEVGKNTETVRRKLLAGLAKGVVACEKRYAKAGARVMMVDHWKFAGKAKQCVQAGVRRMRR